MKYSSKIYAMALLEALEEKSQAEAVRKFLFIMRRNGDFSKLPNVLRDFKKAYNKKHRIKEVKITLAREEKNVVNQVKEILKLKQEPEVEIQKEMLGGVMITIDDEIIVDGNVQSRLQKIFK